MNILGIRELTIDGIINNFDLKNIKYGGGGTAHNIIWNLRGYGYNLFIGGNAGIDLASQEELKILLREGINVDFLKIKKKASRKVFTYISKESKNVIKCPLCKKDTWKTSTEYKIDEDLFKEKKFDIVIFDSYKSDNNKIAEMCIKNNILTILDWGVIGNLRDISKEQLLNIKENPYKIIQLNRKVARFLKSRLDMVTDRKLFKFLNLELMIITDSVNGSIFIDKENEQTVILNIKQEEIRDNNGAGDSHLASVIVSYIESEYSKNKDFNLFLKYQIKNMNNKVKNTLKTVGARCKYNYYNIAYSNDENVCSICLNKNKKKSNVKKFKLVTAVEQIRKRVENGINKKNLKQVRNFLDNLSKNDRIMFIGQGASYIAAKYIEKIISINTCAFIKSFHINEVINNKEIEKYNKAVIVSNSGNSPDVKKVISYLEKKDIYLITSKQEIEEKNINLISYYNSKWTRERGFLSIEGILLPVLLYALQYTNYDKNGLFEIIEETETEIEKINVEKISEGSIIDIIYDNNTYELALDLESKFTESGIARVLLHEKKDFSHGRFSILKNIKPKMVIYLNFLENNKYEEKLIEYIQKKEINIIYLGAEKSENYTENYIYNIILLQQFIKKVSLYLNIDLSDPGYDNEDKKLYKYK